ncbi:MAG: hypothetical protein Q9219_003856 [cf. Caloplaca sp. 3 TL-2023]
MNTIISRPDSEILAVEPENYPKKAPESDQTHVRHDGIYEPALLNPGVDVFREAVTISILVDGDGNENASCNRLVRIHCVGRGDGRQRGDLNASTGVSDDDDDLKYDELVRAVGHDISAKKRLNSTFQLHWCSYPNATMKFPNIMISTYGIMVGSLISGSLMPLLRNVSFILIQSLSGPAVTSPMRPPTKMAKLVKPTAMGEKL